MVSGIGSIPSPYPSFGAQQGHKIGLHTRKALAAMAQGRFGPNDPKPLEVYPFSNVTFQQNPSAYLRNVSDYGNEQLRAFMGLASEDPRQIPFEDQVSIAHSDLGDNRIAQVADVNRNGRMEGTENGLLTFVQDLDKNGTVTNQEIEQFENALFGDTQTQRILVEDFNRTMGQIQASGRLDEATLQLLNSKMDVLNNNTVDPADGYARMQQLMRSTARATGLSVVA